jgi:hypothetical protein
MFKTGFNQEFFPSLEVLPNEERKESNTVQGESFTVRELFQKMATGNVPEIIKRSIWNDHPSFDNWDRFFQNMDLEEARQLALSMAERKQAIEDKRLKEEKQEYDNLVQKTAELQAKITELESKKESD